MAILSVSLGAATLVGCLGVDEPAGDEPLDTVGRLQAPRGRGAGGMHTYLTFTRLEDKVQVGTQCGWADNAFVTGLLADDFGAIDATSRRYGDRRYQSRLRHAAADGSGIASGAWAEFSPIRNPNRKEIS